jgi:hypothetical protein
MERIKSSKFQGLTNREMNNISGGSSVGSIALFNSSINPIITIVSPINPILIEGKEIACDGKKRELLRVHDFRAPDGQFFTVKLYGPTTLERLQGRKSTDACLQCED